MDGYGYLYNGCTPADVLIKATGQVRNRNFRSVLGAVSAG